MRETNLQFFFPFADLLDVQRAQKKPSSHVPETQNLGPLGEGGSEDGHAKGRDDAQHDGHGLPQLDGARDGCAAQDDRRENAELHAVGVAVVDAVSAEAVWRRGKASLALGTPGRFRDLRAREREWLLTEEADGAAGYHGGDGPRPRVPGDAARGREGREDVRRCVQTGRLWRGARG